MKSLILFITVSMWLLLPSQAAFDVFIRFKQNGTWLLGDSNDQYMKAADGWSELRSFEFGIENNINIGSTTGGGGAGKATFKEISITKSTNRISPRLFAACATGQHYDVVEIVAVRTGTTTTKGVLRLFLLEMKLVMVQDLSLSGSDGDDVVEESVILQHGAQRITFFGKDKAEQEQTIGSATWSRVLNNGTFEVQ